MNSMTKKIIFLVFALILSAVSIEAKQDNTKSKEERMEQFFNARVKKMKQELMLSDEQTKQFIPVYKAYLDEMRKDFKGKKQQRDEMQKVTTNDEACKVLTESIDGKIRVLNVQKKYIPKFSKVLNTQQLMKLLKVENDMQRKIRAEWKDRKNRHARPKK